MIVGEVHGPGGEHRAEREAGKSGGGHPRSAGQTLKSVKLFMLSL